MSAMQATIDELRRYMPELTRREDFDEFWEGTLRSARAIPLRPERAPIEYPSPYVKVRDISYCGFDSTRIRGWLLLPAFAGKGRLPCVVAYHGFGGSRGFPSQHMHWAAMGLAVIAVDCRDQGGDTGNAAAYSSGTVGNVNSKGALHQNEYYYRAVYADCARALDFAESCPEIDMGRIVVRGSSQGGALAIAVCALDPRPALCIANVPSNSNIEARVEGRHGSFASVNEYLRRFPDRIGRVYQTLSYFDTMNMADRIKCKVFASVALADPVCPAKCFFATYNRITSEKHIDVYPFNEHDGAGDVHLEKELRYIRDSIPLQARA
jgi:cephalosporin-C deacetylase